MDANSFLQAKELAMAQAILTLNHSQLIISGKDFDAAIVRVREFSADSWNSDRRRNSNFESDETSRLRY